MNLSDEIVNDLKDVWHAATMHTFTEDLCSDVLNDLSWQKYLIQDYAFVGALKVAEDQNDMEVIGGEDVAAVLADVVAGGAVVGVAEEVEGREGGGAGEKEVYCKGSYQQTEDGQGA